MDKFKIIPYYSLNLKKNILKIIKIFYLLLMEEQIVTSNDKKPIIDEKIEYERNNEFFKKIKEKKNFPFFEVLKSYLDLEKNDKNNSKSPFKYQFKFENELKFYTLVKIKKEETDDINFSSAFLFIFCDKIILMDEQLKIKIEKKEKMEKEKKSNEEIMKKIEKNIETLKKEKEEIKKANFLIIEYSNFFNFYLIYQNNDYDNVLGINFEYYDNDFIKRKKLCLLFDYEKDTYLSHHFIKKYYILEWQRLFESTILNDYPKLIYNSHFILNKINRWDTKQERTLLITNALLMNIKHDFRKEGLNFKIKNVKWADSIAAISKLEMYKNKENFVVIYIEKVKNNAQIIDYMGSNNLMKYKSNREFEFYNSFERNTFLGLLRKNYFDLTNVCLKIELKEKK